MYSVYFVIGSIRQSAHSNAMTHGYFGAADGGSVARILRPASVYCPKSRTVAMASNETGIHILFSSAYCRVI